MKGFMSHSIILLLIAVCISGCAMANSKNRRLLNALDERVQPASTAAKVAAAPVFVPVGCVAFAADAVVIHPATCLPKAAKDAKEFVWGEPSAESGTSSQKAEEDDNGFYNAMLFVPKVVATPCVFVIDWGFRSLFDFVE